MLRLHIVRHTRRGCVLAAASALLWSWPAEAGDSPIGEISQPPPHVWSSFVPVKGQPDRVPSEWVATEEGRFAHELVIPNPVPARPNPSVGKDPIPYFRSLCEKEAGITIFTPLKAVDGFLMLRPPGKPTDYDLMDRRKLEAPLFEMGYQGMDPTVTRRGRMFVWDRAEGTYAYYEEPGSQSGEDGAEPKPGYVHAHGWQKGNLDLLNVVRTTKPRSRYALTWRGIKRPMDRELGISGVEVIVLDLKRSSVVAVYRDFGLTGRTRGVREGIWWLNAALCPVAEPNAPMRGYRQRFKRFVYEAMPPPPRSGKSDAR